MEIPAGYGEKFDWTQLNVHPLPLAEMKQAGP